MLCSHSVLAVSAASLLAASGAGTRMRCGNFWREFRVPVFDSAAMEMATPDGQGVTVDFDLGTLL